MAWNTVQYHLSSQAPLIMHNGMLADPFNSFSRKIKLITSKRKKTDADLEEIAHLEFLGGLYLNDSGPILPALAIEATIVNGAKKIKEGLVAKAGMFVPDHVPLIYDGPRDPEELWKTEAFHLMSGVRVGQSKVMRMRPIFNTWSADITISFEDTVVTSKGRIDEWLRTAGTQVGILEWRPRYGRFTVTNGNGKTA